MSRTLITLLCGLAAPSLALADTVTVTFEGMISKEVVTLHRGDDSMIAWAGPMDLDIDGEAYVGYCVDLDNGIGIGDVFEAYQLPAGTAEQWCEVSYIFGNYEASDSTRGAAIQIAVWKTLYPDEVIYVDDATIDGLADSIVEDAAGQCPLSCDDDASVELTLVEASDGLLYGTGTVDRTSGDPVAGQEVVITASAGTLIEPADGVAQTDSAGMFDVVLDPSGATSLTIDLDIDAWTLYRLEPAYEELQELGVIIDECAFAGEGEVGGSELGEPRTIGFWKHQLADKGRTHVPISEIESWLPLDVFDTTYTTVEELYDILWMKRTNMQERAQQQCLATALNVAWGRSELVQRCRHGCRWLARRHAGRAVGRRRSRLRRR